MRVAGRGGWLCMAKQGTDNGKAQPATDKDAGIGMAKVVDADALKPSRLNEPFPCGPDVLAVRRRIPF